MPLTVSQVTNWITELEVVASISNSPLLREIANALDEGLVTGRIYINDDTQLDKGKQI